MARVLVPLPDHDFDVTEVAVPWKALRKRSSSSPSPPSALSGKGLPQLCRVDDLYGDVVAATQRIGLPHERQDRGLSIGVRGQDRGDQRVRYHAP